MKTVEELTELGFNRWTKNGMDRMYINAKALGLDCSYYHTGNICGAEFRGEHVSNSEARRMQAAKTYIDLKTGKVHSDNYTLLREAEELAGIEHEDERKWHWTSEGVVYDA